jgi:hypothetical protein
MRVAVPNEKKKWVTDPDHFKNHIICITEVADAKQYTALKAFAELNEFSTYSHKKASGNSSVDLSVRGPRGIWISSVLGVGGNESDMGQVNRRFIHAKMDEENEARREARVGIITDTLLSQTSLKEDPRKLICRAGYDLLFAAKGKFERPTNEVGAVISDLNVLLDRKDYSPSQFKQLYALIECGAALRQYQRHYCKIELQDVLEGWYLSGFETDREMLLGGKWLHPIDPMDGC